MPSVLRWISREYRGTRAFARTPVEGRVVLYQMGKVGSTAVSDGLREKGIWVLHVHSLDTDTLGRHLRHSITANEFPPPSIVHGYALARTIPRLVGGVRVVTLIRDPIARDLSVFFQDLFRSQTGKRLLQRGDHGEILSEYVANNTLGYTLGWFDAELKRFLGIDVYAHPFDPAKGTATYRSEGINLILLKSELGAVQKGYALGHWLGVDALSIPTSNVSKGKEYGDEYRHFTNTVRLPSWLVEQAIESRFACHFYSERERNEITARWTTGGDHSPSESGPSAKIDR